MSFLYIWQNNIWQLVMFKIPQFYHLLSRHKVYKKLHFRKFENPISCITRTQFAKAIHSNTQYLYLIRNSRLPSIPYEISFHSYVNTRSPWLKLVSISLELLALLKRVNTLHETGNITFGCQHTLKIHVTFCTFL